MSSKRFFLFAFLISSQAFALSYSEKYRPYADCMTAAHNLSTSIDMPVKSRDDQAELCRGSQSTGPVDCAKAANELAASLDPKQVATLCAGVSNVAPVNCMKEASKALGVSGSYVGTTENAVRLCSRAKDNRALDCAKELSKYVTNQVDATFKSPNDVAAVCSLENQN